MGDFVELNKDELKDFQNQDLTEIHVTGNTGFYIYCNIKPITPEIIEKKRCISSLIISHEHSK